MLVPHMTKLDEIRALGQTEMVRRFGAPRERRPVAAIPGVTKGVNKPVNTHLFTHHKPVNTVDKRKVYRREWMRKQRAAKRK
jgi:hypothetical protein